MAGGGRYPNPDDQRRNRNERAFDWTVLPMEGRPGPAPELPPWREWRPATLDWWAKLWATPQATQWDQSGRTLHTLAILHHQLLDEESSPSPIAAEMRQHEDRHGLTPKAMLQLRWKISSTPSDGSGKVLHLVPREVAERVAAGRPDPAQMPAKRAGKAAWIEWAVACGMERSTAEKLSKARLIAEYSSIAAAPAESPPADRPVSRAAERVRAAQAAKKPAKRPPRKGGRKGKS